MYISIDMQRMLVLHKHPSMNVVLNLVYLECPDHTCQVSDMDLCLKHKSELELKMLYRNLIGPDLPNDFKEQIIHHIINNIPVTEADPEEVARLASTVGPNDKKKYKYVRGQFSSFMTPTVFDNTPKDLKFEKNERTGILMPVASSVAVKPERRTSVPKAPKEPRAPKDPSEPAGRPKAGSATGRVWEIADEVAETITDEKALRKSVIDKCIQEGINKSTASVQFGKWKTSR